MIPPVRSGRLPTETLGPGFVSNPIPLDDMYNCAYIGLMDVEWNNNKATSNKNKHGIDFAEAASVLHDEMAVTIQDNRTEDARFITIGMNAFQRVLVIVYTWRGDRPRLISARKATSRERRQYEG